MLKIKNLHKSFSDFSNTTKVLKGVNFQLTSKQTLGLIGPSGCGKTTTALCIAGLTGYEQGDIMINDQVINRMTTKKRNIWLRKHVQYIFQDASETLNPMKRIEVIFKESIKSLKKVTKKDYNYTFIDVLNKVHLSQSDLKKYPNEFSGGEKQRICIARALLAEPVLLIADEPASNLDVTTQAAILNLLKSLNKEGSTILYITHDLKAAYYLCDKICIMRDGEIIETGRCDEIFNSPKSEFTKSIIGDLL